MLDALQFTGKAYALDSDGVMDQIEGKFPYPLIVKPVNLGVVGGHLQGGGSGGLRQALDTALGFSARVLVEPAVQNLREINCAVLGDADDAEASVCEEPAGCDEILSYKDKYLSGGKGAKAGGAKTAGHEQPQAPLSGGYPRGAGPAGAASGGGYLPRPGLFRRGPDRFPQRHPVRSIMGQRNQYHPRLPVLLSVGGSRPAL